MVLLQTKLAVAVKNNMGEYQMEEFSAFRFYELPLSFSQLKVQLKKGGEYKMSVLCPICGEIHHYFFQLKDLFNHKTIIGGCETLGTPIFFLGSPKEVNYRIEKYREINRKIRALI